MNEKACNPQAGASELRDHTGARMVDFERRITLMKERNKSLKRLIAIRQVQRAELEMRRGL